MMDVLLFCCLCFFGGFTCLLALGLVAFFGAGFPLLFGLFLFVEVEFHFAVHKDEGCAKASAGAGDKAKELAGFLLCQEFSHFFCGDTSAILLSAFTEDYRSLLWGVNIGGTGTLIASLASLITFRTYTKHYKGKTASFLGLFSLISFAFFGILLGFCLIIQ